VFIFSIRLSQIKEAADLPLMIGNEMKEEHTANIRW
jgi:hypothetical protein